jgi:molybdenum cofactor cytidylyltransferase
MKKTDQISTIGGLILAAGRSERMGKAKPNLPWGNTTVLGQVIRTLAEGGLCRIYIVINPLRKPEIPENLPDVEITWIENPAAEKEEMLKSIQTGLSGLPANLESALICLGDQPTISPDIVHQVLVDVELKTYDLIIPSYRYRRGHPWAVNKKYWPEICNLNPNQTVRTFIQAHENEIHYVNIDLDLPEDLDTPEMYILLKQKAGM